MLAIFKRELKAYFLSPIAYVFMTVFFLFADFFFWMGNIRGKSAAVDTAFGSMQIVLMFIVPVLTMKLLADERRTKTDQLLLTAPVRISSIVIGKYLAALSVFAVSLVVSLVFPLVLFIFGNPDIGTAINTYVGFFLLGASFIAICLFTSSLTDSQITASILGFTSLLGLLMLEFIGGAMSIRIVNDVINWLAVLRKYQDFLTGILKPESVIYLISVVILFIFLTIRSIEKRRWSEG